MRQRQLMRFHFRYIPPRRDWIDALLWGLQGVIGFAAGWFARGLTL